MRERELRMAANKKNGRKSELVDGIKDGIINGAR